MQNKNKNNRKVTKNYPPQSSLKLPLPIVIFFHNLEIALTYCVLKHCKHFQIENDVYEIGKSAICWLGFCFKFQFLRSYTIDITQLEIETEGKFSWFPLRIYRKINVKSGGKNEPIWWNEQNTTNFKHEYHIKQDDILPVIDGISCRCQITAHCIDFALECNCVPVSCFSSVSSLDF